MDPLLGPMEANDGGFEEQSARHFSKQVQIDGKVESYPRINEGGMYERRHAHAEHVSEQDRNRRGDVKP